MQCGAQGAQRGQMRDLETLMTEIEDLRAVARQLHDQERIARIRQNLRRVHGRADNSAQMGHTPPQGRVELMGGPIQVGEEMDSGRREPDSAERFEARSQGRADP